MAIKSRKRIHNSKIMRWFSSLKLKHKVRYLFLFIISIYFIMFFGVYSLVVKRDMLNYTLQSNLNTMVSIGSTLNAEIDTIDNMSQLIITNKDVVSFLKNTNGQELTYTHNAMSAVYDISNVFSHISSVFIIRTDSSYINTSRGITKLNYEVFTNPLWNKEIEERAGGYVLRVNGGGAFSTSKGPQIISFIRIINDLESQKPIGMLAINFSPQLFEKIYQNMEGNGKHFCFYDNKNMFIGTQEPIEELQNLKFTNDKYAQESLKNGNLLSYYHIPETPFIIASFEKFHLGQTISDQAGSILLVVLIVTSGALILIGIFITTYITHPIERLAQSMNSVKSGWLRRLSLSLSDDEIGNLKDSYNEMLVEINGLIQKLLEKEKAIQKAELEVLQEQIKPHFLYNTLDMIGYLALTEPAEDVYDAINTLGSFYKKFLSRGSKEITIAQEIGIVKDYLKLQKLRYGDIFDDLYQVEEELLTKQIPKLILQPLVENSIYHGIRLKGEKCMIKISIYSENNRIHIVVYDDGIGMPSDMITSIMSSGKSKSFGFKGTIERIQYYYNREDVYEIRSEEGQYTEIHIKLPMF